MIGSHRGSYPAPELWQFALVVGGARSGKSRIAEKLVTARGMPLVYIATAEAWDDEMRVRIAQHRHDRGPDWSTVEAPLDLADAVAAAPAGAAVLVDCATLWLTNHLLAEHDLDSQAEMLVDALGARAGPTAIVSNETGWGIVPDNALARAFRDAQGRLNQRLAARADLVLGVMAGLPFALKGNMPEGLT